MTDRHPLHVFVRLAGQLYALPVDRVSEMVRLPELTPVPNASDDVRGLMHLRGASVPVHDMRTLLGVPPLAAEIDALVEMLDQRERDHRNWLAELERTVEEGRPFTLATDPHKCAFGRWYDTFEPTNLVLQNLLPRFDGPHKRIHALAIEVDRLVRDGEKERAMRRIEATRGRELAEMITLFANMREVLRNDTREVAVVLEPPSGTALAYSVDLVESVAPVRFVERDDASDGLAATPELPTANCRFALYGQKDEVAIVIDDRQLLVGARGPAAA
ncbi:MAG: chemotaxis protein CheW [Planctomycetota bacterium]